MKYPRYSRNWFLKGIAALLTLITSACSGNYESIQPIAQFYIKRDDFSEEDVLGYARTLAARYEMRVKELERGNKDVEIIFSATRNSWLYHHGIVKGTEADFSITDSGDRIRISVIGPTGHEVTNELSNDWATFLKDRKIPYEKNLGTDLGQVRPAR